MRKSSAALGLALALTFGGSSLASPDGETDAPAGVEDDNGAGAYLAATMALLGLAGLAAVTRRDYVRAQRRNRQRKEPIAQAPPSTAPFIGPIEPLPER